MYLQSTSLTHGHSSPYLGPGTWVLTFGVLANGSKMICQPLGQLLGPGSWVQSQGSTFFLCNLIFGTQTLGPVNLWDTYWVLGPGYRVLGLGPRTWDPRPGLRTCSVIGFLKQAEARSLECCVRFCLFIQGLFLLIRPLYQFSLQLLI